MKINNNQQWPNNQKKIQNSLLSWQKQSNYEIKIQGTRYLYFTFFVHNILDYI